MTILLAWIGMYVGSCILERFTLPRSPFFAGSWLAESLRIFVFTVIFSFFFACSWRPYFSAVATWVFVGVFVAICRGKVWFVHEPLVFADLAFILDVFRYPKLFYSTFLKPLYLISVVTFLIALITTWFVFESQILPQDHMVAAIAVLAFCWLLVVAGPFLPGVRRIYEKWALAIVPDPDLEADIARNGHLATLVAHFLAWRGDDRAKRIANWSPRPNIISYQEADKPADLIVTVQCESFYDLRRLGMDDVEFPELDQARKRAVSWGQLSNSFDGGYTLRTEFAFLSGRTPADIGFDRYHPYINATAYADVAIPNALKKAGYATVFMHPFHRRFFSRHKAIPAIGFEKILMLDDFAGAPRKGEHTSDDAVADRLIAQAQACQTPAFLFAATMENHGPWETERFAHTNTPLDVYKEHLKSGDAMLGRLITHFSDWPGRVVLLFYGDHVPVLKAYADPFPDSFTDYVLLELGSKVKGGRTGRHQKRAISELTWDMLELAGLTAKK